MKASNSLAHEGISLAGFADEPPTIDRLIPNISAPRGNGRLLMRRLAVFVRWCASRVLGRCWDFASYPKYLRIEACGSAPGPTGPRFFIRVDDYPHWKCSAEAFCAFHQILAGHSISYLLGVTPFLALDPFDPTGTSAEPLCARDRELLAAVTRDGACLAVHGYSHRTRPGRWRSEMAGVPADELERLLRVATESVGSLDVGVFTFIPPFNSFGWSAIPVLERYFSVVCGGPESIRTLGAYPFPSHLGSNLLYVPSYPPAYGRATQVVQLVRELKRADEPVLVPLTLHWAWEVENDFSAVADLARELEGLVLPWHMLRGIRGYFANLRERDGSATRRGQAQRSIGNG